MERQQVLFYLAAIVTGIALGLLAPGSERLAVAINPAIAALLFVTFLGVPFAEIARGFRDVRFLTALLVLNFVIVPVVAVGLSRFVAHDDALLVGVLLVLLTPCVDYVIVFAGAAGGAHERLLAATPLLMVVQLLLLPLYLFIIAGPVATESVEPGPFMEAMVLLILIPLGAATLTQWAARRVRLAAAATASALHAMVPLTMLVLLVVIASQTPAIARDLVLLVELVPIYIAFLAVMAALGVGVARLARLDVPRSRALVFSGATRNSLVVLPLALALPPDLRLAAAAIVTQTLVELIGMAIYVKLIPRLLPPQAARP
ncbi:arsenic resistance protein [Agrococcus carbonis]|uniref:Arsenite efflux pump ArsB, ACR3 family n=1 Tax=Agrococcus carbonis TaxID=684552 RepID=A0A1H1KTY2_9MICO|nr:bile acid:sodium symporter [Agrococcus carbonis]SDR65139.1 Arsenite efflux pump ArsB, ACR3 family [Agrococcus carbonis]